jgi:prepilin-type N-terminal cleavage/methylation domain-containing protein
VLVTMNRRMSPRRSERGLTLVELMVTVALLAIIATVAAPSFGAFIAASKLRGIANEVYADLQFARAESVQENRAFRVEFAQAGYRIWRMDRNNPAQHDAATVAKPNPIKDVQWDAGSATATSGSTMVVAFDPVRASATIADGPLVLSHAAISGTLRLTVFGTGRAELCSPAAGMRGFAAC